MRRLDRCIGRDFELAALRAELEATLRGEGRVVLLEGEAGIGKTLLLGCLAEAAAGRGFEVLHGRCRDQPGCPEYWPFIEVFGSSASAAATSIAASLRAGPGARGALGTVDDPERARFELYDSVARGLAALADDGPRVVIIDDLHASDRGSLELLAYLGRDVSTRRILLAAATRPVHDSRLDAIRLLGRSLPLAGLEPTAVSSLLSREVGHEFSCGGVEQVHGLTSGNPFFVTQIAQLLAAGPDPDGGELALPPRAREIPARRLAALSDEALALLETAAVYGLEFCLALLAPAVDRSPAEVRVLLEAPLASDIVREKPGALQRFGFSHALMREALLERIPAEDLARRHLAVARAIEELHPDAGPFALAHHYFEAARVGDPTPAVRYACDAGDHALESLAFDQAIEQFERALAALELAPSTLPEEHVRALVGCGIACRRGGQPERAERLFSEGTERARALGPAAFAEMVLRIALQRAEFQLLDVGTNELLREALRLLPDEPSPLRSRVLARLASGLHLDPEAADERLAMSRAAIEMARETGDPRALGFARTRGLSNLYTPDHPEERARSVAEILDDASTPVESELEARLCQLDQLAREGDRKRLDVALARYECKARESGHPYHVWQVATNRAAVALVEGRFAEAEKLASEALVLGQRVAPQSAGVRFAAQLLRLRGWQGRLSEVAPLVEQSVDEAQLVPAWRCALAGLYSHLGRDAEARREFEALAASDFEELPRDSTWLVSMGLLADVCCRLGDRERAATLAQMLEPFSGQIAVAVPLLVLEAQFDVRLGSLALLLGDCDRAIELHRRAFAVAERMRATPWQVEARYHLAVAHAARASAGDEELSLELLDQAETVAGSLGMGQLTGWIATAREDLALRATPALQATGTHGPVQQRVTNVVRLPSARTEVAANAFRREGDVWSLVYEGRTNRFRHMRGLVHLARLLAEPGGEVHVTDLAGMPREASDEDSGEQLDDLARADYQRRLREAQEDLEDAESMNDRGRIELRSEEIEWLSQELTRGFGLGGRARRAGSASERARLSVTRAIKYAIDKIDGHDAALADHLRRNVRTGTFCSYAPPPRDSPSWKL